MTNCDDCRLARSDVLWFRFNPACATCGARCLWFLQRMRLPLQQKRERLQKALADWMAYGHAEEQLRTLATQDWVRWSRADPRD